MKKSKVELTVTSAVPSVMNVLDEKLNALKKITDQPYKTTGMLDCGGQRIDIKTETNIENLQKAFSSVLGRKKLYDEAGEVLGIKTFKVFEVSGGTMEDWKSDIQIRLAVLQYENRKKKLQTAKEKMAKFMSEEDQKALVMKEVIALLGDGDIEE